MLGRQNEPSGRCLQDRFRPAHKRPRSYAYSTQEISCTIYADQANLSIHYIVKALLSAGSDATAADISYKKPLDLAIQYGCEDMVLILQSVARVTENNSYDQRLQTVMEPRNLSPFTMDLQEPSSLLKDPHAFLSFLALDNIEWLATQGGNITGVDELTPPSSYGQSLIYAAISHGLSRLVDSFGPLVRFNDDPKAVLERIHKLDEKSEYNPPIEYLAPALHMACCRELSNLDMIEVLVERCNVDINARALVKLQEWQEAKESIEGGTAVHVLARANHWWHLEAIKYLLRRGGNIESINEKGETPLHIACTGTTFADMNCSSNIYGYWRIECVKILLDLGANPNVLDVDGLSCLHKASSSPQIMRMLLEYGADISAGKLSPLFSAIQIQCLETLTILLDAGVSPNVIDPSSDSKGFKLDYFAEGNTRWALFCVSFAGLHNQRSENSAPMVKRLIERGANIYAPLTNQRTLLHYVFEHAEYEIADAFLGCARCLDFSSRDSKGRTVFLAACDWIQCLPGYQHLHWYPKETALFLRILEFGADPLAVDNDGRNALHHLLDNPNMEDEAIMEFLTHDTAKALLHQKDSNGFTPLACALRSFRPAVVSILLSKGADLLSPDPTGATALHQIAAQCLDIKTPSTRRYISRDHKPEFYTGLLSLWEKFLELGGSINVRDNQGSPPLFSYLSTSPIYDYRTPEGSCSHLENFNTYYSGDHVRDIDFLAKNKNGQNALHIIAGREKSSKNPYYNKELFTFFIQKGLNPLEEDDFGRTSLDVAVACEQKDILELFQYRK